MLRGHSRRGSAKDESNGAWTEHLTQGYMRMILIGNDIITCINLLLLKDTPRRISRPIKNSLSPDRAWAPLPGGFLQEERDRAAERCALAVIEAVQDEDTMQIHEMHREMWPQSPLRHSFEGDFKTFQGKTTARLKLMACDLQTLHMTKPARVTWIRTGAV